MHSVDRGMMRRRGGMGILLVVCCLMTMAVIVSRAYAERHDHRQHGERTEEHGGMQELQRMNGFRKSEMREIAKMFGGGKETRESKKIATQVEEELAKARQEGERREGDEGRTHRRREVERTHQKMEEQKEDMRERQEEKTGAEENMEEVASRQQTEEIRQMEKLLEDEQHSCGEKYCQESELYRDSSMDDPRLVGAADVLNEGKGHFSGQEDVREFVRRYYFAFDTCKLANRVGWFFHPNASMHLIMPDIPDDEFDMIRNMNIGKKTVEEGGEEGGQVWRELHLQGAKEIRESTISYLKHAPKHKTYYEIAMMDPAVGGAMYVTVQGIMRIEENRAERFVQTFLILPHHAGGPLRHKIRFTTITGGIHHRCCPKPTTATTFYHPQTTPRIFDQGL